MTGRNRKMYLVAGLAIVLTGSVIWWVSRVMVGKSRLDLSRDEDHFPTVSGFNLMREEFIFPEDFQGVYNLVIIPFQQRQQEDVNTWIPAAQELERKYPDLVYYELPTIYELPALSRTFINEGMRAGIPDQLSRERTVTFYLDKSVFKDALGITTEQNIQIFLVDREGNILWREEGLFTADKNQSLQNLLNTLK